MDETDIIGQVMHHHQVTNAYVFAMLQGQGQGQTKNTIEAYQRIRPSAEKLAKNHSKRVRDWMAKAEIPCGSYPDIITEEDVFLFEHDLKYVVNTPYARTLFIKRWIQSTMWSPCSK